MERDSVCCVGRISIHALRGEGDLPPCRCFLIWENFYPRPPWGGRPQTQAGKLRRFHISIHALRGEGDQKQKLSSRIASNFYPRPPWGGRRRENRRHGLHDDISIHALRGEGDIGHSGPSFVFRVFLSTPSVGRATFFRLFHRQPGLDFYPRPPWGGRRWAARWRPPSREISIHALRGEGDNPASTKTGANRKFLSTPSVGRATQLRREGKDVSLISIHALRGEGDAELAKTASMAEISIHALRGEGDHRATLNNSPSLYFYPRPPWGGRPVKFRRAASTSGISIHALRGEGDTGRLQSRNYQDKFLSTPSVGRATPIT